MTNAPNVDERFHTELLKLLLQVAWSDEEVDPSEARAVLKAAHRWQVPLSELEKLESCLEQGKAMPAPNLGLLRSRPEEVLTAVRALISSDSQVQLSEKETLAQIQELLGLTPS